MRPLTFRECLTMDPDVVRQQSARFYLRRQKVARAATTATTTRHPDQPLPPAQVATSQALQAHVASTVTKQASGSDPHGLAVAAAIYKAAADLEMPTASTAHLTLSAPARQMSRAEARDFANKLQARGRELGAEGKAKTIVQGVGMAADEWRRGERQRSLGTDTFG